MREILFRAKRLDNGEWVEGLLCFNMYNQMVIQPCSSFICTIVEPETVCQFTGLTDKNGKKIFEGDIVKEFDLFNEYKGKGVVHVSDTFVGWYISESKSLFRLYKYEVIGNIFDDPELMEGGVKND